MGTSLLAIMKPVNPAITAAIQCFATENQQQLQELKDRPFCFLACGSTKLGLEVGIDMAQRAVKVYDDPSLIKTDQLVVGLTFSGNSTEVVDFSTERKSLPHLLITSSSQLTGGHVLKINSSHVTNRQVPLFAAFLALHLLGFDIDGLNNEEDCKINLELLINQLVLCKARGKTPFFVADRSTWFAKIFAEQYMEFLKKPAFALHYPHFTHNLLWSLDASQSEKYHFFWLQSDVHYSDSREAKTKGHLKDLGFQINEVPLAFKNRSSIEMLSLCLDVYGLLSTKLGIRPNVEYSFNHNP